MNALEPCKRCVTPYLCQLANSCIRGDVDVIMGKKPDAREQHYATALELLRDLEWSGRVTTDDGTIGMCPVCFGWNPDFSRCGFWNGRERRRGHAKDCRLALFLQEAGAGSDDKPTKEGGA